MFELIKALINDLYEYEGGLVTEARTNGYKIIRPSSCLLIIISILYLLSPIDIVSEAIVSPKFMGYIDDILILIFIGAYVYTDVRGVIVLDETDGEAETNGTEDRIQNRGHARAESTRQDKVLSEDRSSIDYWNNSDTGDSNSVHNREELQQDVNGSNRSIDDLLNSSDADNSEDNEEYSTVNVRRQIFDEMQ